MPKSEVLEGDALAVLQTLPAGSFHCCATSPPYWGLREYGTGTGWVATRSATTLR